MTPDDVRGIVAGWPETVEQPHHGFPSFRVRGKIFATMPDDDRLHVMTDADAVDAAVAEAPGYCEPLWWGKKLSGVRVALAGAEPGFVGDLVRGAWERKAPRALLS